MIHETISLIRRAARVGAVLVLAGTVALAGCGQKKSASGGKGHGAGGPAPVAVEVAAVKTGSIAYTVPVVGSIQALEDVQVSARTAGRVTAVTVREGGAVKAGQVLVQQDTTDLEANVRQDQASVQSAIAQVDQADVNLQIQITQAKQNTQQARATLAAAQQNYLKLKGGSRPQQILQSQAQVAQARADVQNAKTILERDKSLYQQGALAKADLDQAQTTYDVNTQLLKNAQASLSLTQAGYQQEDIAAAQQQVREQQANLNTQIANEKQVAVRKGEIEAAQAAVRQARAKLAFDQQQVAYATIKSPIDGIVAARNVDPGQVATSGTTVMRIVNVKTVYYEPTISETDFSRISVGNPVTVQVDAIPGKTFAGMVKAVYPAASTTNRVFSLRVAVPNPKNELRPGMYARGSILTAVHRNVIVVPVTALVPQQTQNGLQINESSAGLATGSTTMPPQQVYVVGPGSKAVAQPVKLGIVTSQKAEIVSGLKPGDSLITTGQGMVHTGDKVQVVTAANRTADLPKYSIPALRKFEELRSQWD